MIRILLLTSLFFIFSCSSKPIQIPTSRKAPAPHSTRAQPAQINKVLETVVADPGLTAPPQAETSKAPFAASQAPQELTDYLIALKTPNIPKKNAADIIDNHLTKSQLENAAADVQLQTYRPQILWRLANLAQKENKTDQAVEYYQSLATQFPQHFLAAQSQQLAALLQASETTDAKVIGAILPLTGKNANVGQHALNALRMGLGLNKTESRYRLAVYDTQSLPESAGLGVDKLVRDDKVIALIGGLSSKEATGIAQRAEFLNLPFIALSQKSGLTNIGEFIFRNSLTPEMQVDQLVQYAYDKLGARRFAVLYPNDSYGVEFSNIYWDHVLARNAQVVAAQTYDPKENDFTNVIKKLVGTYYPEARPDEYRDRMKELRLAKKDRAEKNKNKKNSREHETEENVLSPIVDFDVLFLPDSGKSLGQVMAFMKVNDVPKLTYLGTNIWNTPDIVKRTGTQADGIFFVDAVDLNDTRMRETDFFKEYVAQYNEEPTLIEMQAFESAKIIRDVTSSGATTRDSVASRLRSLGRSPGITGELRMSNLRELERPVHVLSLDKGIIKKIE
ncbi:MAG: penicillin-binding protein activator [Bdellovibrio sp.]|nr:penicillin-binding protein activator [Bdellovibrio sp.]